VILIKSLNGVGLRKHSSQDLIVGAFFLWFIEFIFAFPLFCLPFAY
jgi:hypothetical protein